jgi:lathosterol oxidase
MFMTFEPFIRIFSVTAIRYFVVAGIPFLLCYVLLSQWLYPSKIQSRQASKRDFIREILHSMQTTIVFAIIACILFYTPLRNYTQLYTNLADYSTWWLYASVVLSLVIHDTYFYWMHRLLHHPKIFKYAHVLHHKSTNPSPWTSYSFHFIEAWTEGLVLVVISMVIPMHAIAIGLFALIGFVINVYGHLGYEIAPKWLRHTILFQISNTSVHHNLHHSKFKGNYGLYFRFWDRVMGTEHPDYVREYDRVQQNRIAKKGSGLTC